MSRRRFFFYRTNVPASARSAHLRWFQNTGPCFLTGGLRVSKAREFDGLLTLRLHCHRVPSLPPSFRFLLAPRHRRGEDGRRTREHSSGGGTGEKRGREKESRELEPGGGGGSGQSNVVTPSPRVGVGRSPSRQACEPLDWLPCIEANRRDR